MKTSDKNGKKSPYPPNVSVNYYTDPVYSTDAYYGYGGQDEQDAHDEVIREAVDKKEEGAPDEPIESWGWINNVD